MFLKFLFERFLRLWRLIISSALNGDAGVIWCILLALVSNQISCRPEHSLSLCDLLLLLNVSCDYMMPSVTVTAILTGLLLQ